MVTSKPKKVFYFVTFLIPAFTLYAYFFIMPLWQGIRYSFTDWNGIVPEIPFTMEKGEFEGKVLRRVTRPADRVLLQKFYRLSNDRTTYLLQNWVTEKGKHRQITAAERRKIKGILKTVGIASIKFIGWENYRKLFQDDTRFLPRLQKTYLFNQFDDLPATIDVKVFQKNLLNHLDQDAQRQLVLQYYRLNRARNAYELSKRPDAATATQLRTVLAEQLYQTKLVWGVLGFTLFFTFFNVIFANLFALLLALALDKNSKARHCLRAIFFLPNVLSMVIVAFIWSFVFRLILPALTGISSWFEPDLAP